MPKKTVCNPQKLSANTKLGTPKQCYGMGIAAGNYYGYQEGYKTGLKRGNALGNLRGHRQGFKTAVKASNAASRGVQSKAKMGPLQTVYTGPEGGKYIMRGGVKVYLKSLPKAERRFYL